MSIGAPQVISANPLRPIMSDTMGVCGGPYLFKFFGDLVVIFGYIDDWAGRVWPARPFKTGQEQPQGVDPGGDWGWQELGGKGVSD